MQNVRVYYICVVYVLYVLRMRVAYAYYIRVLLCYDENMF